MLEALTSFWCSDTHSSPPLFLVAERGESKIFQSFGGTATHFRQSSEDSLRSVSGCCCCYPSGICESSDPGSCSQMCEILFRWMWAAPAAAAVMSFIVLIFLVLAMDFWGHLCCVIWPQLQVHFVSLLSLAGYAICGNTPVYTDQ